MTLFEQLNVLKQYADFGPVLVGKFAEADEQRLIRLRFLVFQLGRLDFQDLRCLECLVCDSEQLIGVSLILKNPPVDLILSPAYQIQSARKSIRTLT